MDAANYEARYRVIKVAAKKVKDSKKRFVAEDVTHMDIDTYESRLKEIRDKLDAFDDAVTDLIVDLDENNADDKLKIGSMTSKGKLLRIPKIELLCDTGAGTGRLYD